MKVHLEHSFTDLPGIIQRALSQPGNNPFFNAHFLRLLEQTGCVCEQSGWQPQHLWVEKDQMPVFYMPVYLKNHSWGEFVFDQSWAQAYARVGLQYYPKLVSCIPFTPSLGPRWWCAAQQSETDLLGQVLAYIDMMLDQLKASSWHMLFSEAKPPMDSSGQVGWGLMLRHDTQFHWLNHGYQHFDDFLNQLKSRKRKGLRKEREKVASQGVRLQRKLGAELSEQDWQRFYVCYCNTYHERGMNPYLSETFFVQLWQSMPEKLMMVQALEEEQMIGAAIFFYDDKVLYGRHWGAIKHVDCLHFEACFYQGIEFCIERGLQRFDPGTQGEHKLLRGFEPVKTDSWHKVAHSGFQQAIADYLQAESSQVERYQSSAAEYLPFKRE